jgi:hypothetical protein
MALSFAERPEPGATAVQPIGFTDKLWALDTRLYRPDPLAVEQASAAPSAAVT